MSININISSNTIFIVLLLVALVNVMNVVFTFTMKASKKTVGIIGAFYGMFVMIILPVFEEFISPTMFWVVYIISAVTMIVSGLRVIYYDY